MLFRLLTQPIAFARSRALFKAGHRRVIGGISVIFPVEVPKENFLIGKMLQSDFIFPTVDHNQTFRLARRGIGAEIEVVHLNIHGSGTEFFRDIIPLICETVVGSEYLERFRRLEILRENNAGLFLSGNGFSLFAALAADDGQLLISRG